MIEATTEEGVGFQDSFLRTDGQGLPFLHMKAGGSVCPASHYTVDHRMHYIYQEGRTVYKYAVTSMSNDVKEIMQRNNLTEADVNWVIPHEANLRIIEAVTKRLDIPMDKVMEGRQHHPYSIRCRLRSRSFIPEVGIRSTIKRKVNSE